MKNFGYNSKKIYKKCVWYKLEIILMKINKYSADKYNKYVF